MHTCVCVCVCVRACVCVCVCVCMCVYVHARTYISHASHKYSLAHSQPLPGRLQEVVSELGNTTVA